MSEKECHHVVLGTGLLRLAPYEHEETGAWGVCFEVADEPLPIGECEPDTNGQEVDPERVVLVLVIKDPRGAEVLIEVLQKTLELRAASLEEES